MSGLMQRNNKVHGRAIVWDQERIHALEAPLLAHRINRYR